MNKELEEFMQMIRGESDRAVPLIVGAYFENWLKEINSAFLVDMSKTKMDDVFGVYKPLGTFSANIIMAFSMGLIREDTRKELIVVKKIRNLFAHNWRMSFQEEEVKKECNKLVLVRSESLDEEFKKKVQGMSNREMFETTSWMLAGAMKETIYDTWRIKREVNTGRG